MAVCGSNQLIAETKVPNDFISGTPAKAAEVNENFISYSCKQSAGASISRTAVPQVPFDFLEADPSSSWSCLRSEIIEEDARRSQVYFDPSRPKTTLKQQKKLISNNHKNSERQSQRAGKVRRAD